MKTMFGWTLIAVLTALSVGYLGILGLFAVPIIVSGVIILLY